MARDRDYQAEYESRVERAHERGYDSFNEQRNAERYVRDEFDLSGDEMREVADFMHGYADGDMSIGELRDYYEDHFGEDYDDQEFYDWLAELYG